MSNSNEYMRKYMLNRYYKIRSELIKILGSQCTICGSKLNLEIDHIDKSKKEIDFGKCYSYSKEKLLKELKKCQLLCNSCHKIKSSREHSVEHGGGLSGKDGCKCDLCRKRKNRYMRIYKFKKRLNMV